MSESIPGKCKWCGIELRSIARLKSHIKSYHPGKIYVLPYDIVKEYTKEYKQLRKLMEE